LNYTLQHITSTLDIKNQEIFPDFNVENISIDSRSLQNNSGTLFFALKGKACSKDYNIIFNELFIYFITFGIIKLGKTLSSLTISLYSESLFVGNSKLKSFLS
jgi:hypothetical protein